MMAKKKGPRWGPIRLDDTPEMMGHISGIFAETARCTDSDAETLRQGLLKLYRGAVAGDPAQWRSAWAALHGAGKEPTPEEIMLFLVEMPLLISLSSDREPSPCEQNTPDAPCTPDRPREDGSR